MTQDATLTQDNTSQSTTTTQDNTSQSNLTFRQCLIQEMNECDQRQKKYEDTIVGEKDEKEIFKLLLLIDVAALGKYILQTQIHADHSFHLSKWMAIVGSCLLLLAIALGTLSQLLPGMHSLEVAYLSVIAGLITQLISGVFFYFYRMTLSQLNDFHSKLEASRKVCVALFILSQINDETERNKAMLKLIKLLVPAEPSDQASKGKQNGKPHEAETASSTSA